MAEQDQIAAFEVDGYTVDKVVLRFGGSVSLDPHDPRHRRLIDAIRLGHGPMLLVRGSVGDRTERLVNGGVAESPKYDVTAALGPDDYSALLTESVGDAWEMFLRTGHAPSYADPGGPPDVAGDPDETGPVTDGPALADPADGKLQWNTDDVAGDGQGGEYQLSAELDAPASERWFVAHVAAGQERAVDLHDAGLSKPKAKARAQEHYAALPDAGDVPDVPADVPTVDPGPVVDDTSDVDRDVPGFDPDQDDDDAATGQD